MIKKFKSFFQDEPVKMNEENALEGVALDDIDKEELEDFEEPEMVSDDKYLSKISGIVYKHLKKNINRIFIIHPFVLTVNGKKCAMIKSEKDSLILFKDGMEKVIAYFNGNPLDGGKSEFSVSTRSLGFLAMIRSIVDFISENDEMSLVAEAKERPEIGPAPKPAYAAFATIAKKLNDTDALPKDAMYEFLKLYEKYEDGEIKSLMLSDADDLSEGLKLVQLALCTKKGSRELDPTATYRNIQVIHMILCGVALGCSDKEANALREVWFWGAGKSGRLAIEYSDAGGYSVKEAASVMEGRVDELEKKMNAVYNAASGICKYIKSGGKDMSMRGEIAKHRGLLITGVAGIGKTVALNKAIKDTGLIENVDFKRMGNATTGAREVYHELYEGNNMLLIYDDTPEMFDTQAKVSLWKLAMEGEESSRLVMNPDGEAKKNSKIFYNASDAGMTRQDKYFREMGKLSPYEHDEWIKNEIKKIRKEIGSTKTGDATYSESALKAMAKERFKDYEANEITSLIPDRFIFNGIIVYISNMTLKSFEKSVGDHWDAIYRRMEVVDISPTQKVIWAWLRRKILADAANTSIPDEQKLFPTISSVEGYTIDDAVKYVDDVMDGKFNDETNTYGQINFGTISNMREYILYGNPNWKDKWLACMQIGANRVR